MTEKENSDVTAESDDSVVAEDDLELTKADTDQVIGGYHVPPRG